MRNGDCAKSQDCDGYSDCHVANNARPIATIRPPDGLLVIAQLKPEDLEHFVSIAIYLVLDYGMPECLSWPGTGYDYLGIADRHAHIGIKSPHFT